MAENESLQLKITLRGFHPPVWRRVVVPDTVTLADLHTIIQIAFDWSNEHLHDFYSTQNAEVHYGPAGDETVQGDEAKTLARPLLEESNVMYTYDFGDDWKHLIHLEKVLPASGFHRAPVPYCVTGRGASPAEDSGGDDTEDRTPLDVAAINRKLSARFSAAPQKASAQKGNPSVKPKDDTTQPKEMTADEIKQSIGEYLQDHPDFGDVVAKPNAASQDKVRDFAKFMLQQAGLNPEAVAEKTPIDDRTLAKQLTTIGKEGTTDAQMDAVVAITSAALTTPQFTHVVQTILDQNWLFAHITATADQTVATRTNAAALLTSLLRDDEVNVPKLILPTKLRHAVFTAATRYAREEKGMKIMSWSDETPLGAAMDLLHAAVTHVSYPKKMLNDLQDTLISIFSKMTAPFSGSEPETILAMLLELAESQNLSKARYKRILARVTKAVFGGPDPVSAIQTLRARAWVQVLLPLAIGLRDESDYSADVGPDILSDVLDFYAYHGVLLGGPDDVDEYDDYDDDGDFDGPF